MMMLSFTLFFMLIWKLLVISAWVSNTSFITYNFSSKINHRKHSSKLHAGFSRTSEKKTTAKGEAVVELSKEAKNILKKHKNNIDAASADYFLLQLQKISQSDEADAYRALNEDDEIVHESRVAAAWNTVALFLPYEYGRTKGKVEPKVERRLRHVASAVVQTPIISDNEDSAYVLDVGCGDGSLVPYLKTANQPNAYNNFSLDKYYGLDISSEMILLARKRWTHAVPPNQWLQGSFPRQAKEIIQELNINSLNGKQNGYAAIIFNGSLQFFQDTSLILKEAAELLQQGGRIILSHVNGSDFVKEECKKNPGIAVRSMPNNVSLDILAHDLGMKVFRKKELNLRDYDDNLDGDDGEFFLVVLEKSLEFSGLPTC